MLIEATQHIGNAAFAQPGQAVNQEARGAIVELKAGQEAVQEAEVADDQAPVGDAEALEAGERESHDFCVGGGAVEAEELGAGAVALTRRGAVGGIELEDGAKALPAPGGAEAAADIVAGGERGEFGAEGQLRAGAAEGEEAIDDAVAGAGEEEI